MPEAIQVSSNLEVYLICLLPLILAEEGGTIEEQYTRYNEHNTNDCCHYDNNIS